MKLISINGIWDSIRNKRADKIVEDIENLIPTKTTEMSDTHTINDATDYEVQNITINGKTTQDGTPTLNNPVEIIGTTGTQTVKVHTKNLLPFNNQDFTYKGVNFKVVDGKLYLDGTSTGEVLSNNSIYSNNFTFTLKPGTYTFSARLEATKSMIIRKVGASSNLANINGVATTKATFTLTEETTCFWGIYIANNSNVNGFPIDAQLEEGSDETTHVKCGNFGQTLHLGDIWLATSGNYKAQIVNVLGEWYFKENLRKVVFDGSVEWSTRTNANSVKEFFKGVGITNCLDNSAQKCNYATYSSSTYNYGHVGNFEVSISNQIIICVDDNETAESWATKLNTTNLVVLIPTSTTRTTKITDETLLAELNNLLNFQTYKDSTIIELSAAADNPAQLEVSYKQNIDKRLLDIESAILSLGANT